MNLELLIDGNIDPVALYAATLSTLIAIWEFLKWKQRNAVELSLTANMQYIPSTDDNMYIIANFINRGDKPTQITHFLGYYCPSRLDLCLGKNIQHFMIKADNIPHTIVPGEQWIGSAPQDEELIRKGRQGILYLGVRHTMSKKDLVKRVKIS